MNKKVIIYGNGKLAELVYFMNKEEGGLEIEAFAADKSYIHADHFLDLPLVEFETLNEIYPPSFFDVLVLVGYSKMRDRKHMFDRAKAKGYMLRNFVSAHATTYQNLKMGENNVIFEGVCLCPSVEMGDNNVIRPHTYVGHDARIGNHVYFAPGSNIGGNCTIKSLSYIGIGGTIIDGIAISEETLIGAGSLVLKNTEPFSKYVGTPAKKIGEHPKTGITFGGRCDA